MVLSTTDKIDGYVVDKYYGIVSGTDIYLVGGMFGGGLSSQEALFDNAMSKAKSQLEMKARGMGANAVISIKQSFTSPGGVNYMILALIGTAVRLKEDKEEEYNNMLPPL